MRRRPRHLSPEEWALWDLVARRTEPLHPVRPARPVPAPRPVPEPALPERAPLPEFRLGQKVDHTRSDDLLPGLAERMGRAPVQMDAKSHDRMKRGKLVPEARIDLHGMTLAEAHPALIGFILNAQARGQRLVLVITGKGKERDHHAPMPMRHGILRHQVPQWLSLPPLSQAVLQVTPAHVRHGGQGAIYVYLRRRR